MHVFNSLGRGGAELRTLEIVRESNLRFAFLSVSGAPAVLDDVVRSEGHLLHLQRVRGPIGIINAARFMKRNDIRVVHSHLGAASGPVLVAAMLAGVPVRIAHSRSDAVGGRDSLQKRVLLAVSRLMVRCVATQIVAVSPSALKGSGLARGRWQQRAAVVPNGLDSRVLRARAEAARGARQRGESGLVVAQIAREEVSKNRSRGLRIWAELARTQRTTLRAIGSMNAEDHALALKLAGDPAVLAAGSRIDFVGETSSIAEELGKSDVLLVTSKREGLPGVVLEALACGTPVVSTNLPGVQWIASETSGVTMLSLDDEDTEWTSAVVLASSMNRDIIASDYEHSPFLLQNATKAHLALWALPTHG